MVAGRFRFHSGCGSRRIGSSTEPTTRRTAAWFASRLRLASSVSCVRPRVNSCRCGLIFVCLAARHDFQGIFGQGSLQCRRRRILRREARRRALLRAQNGHCLGIDRRDDRVRCRRQKVVDLMRPWDRLVPRSPLRRCESAIISNERRVFRLPSASRCDRHRPKVPRAHYPKFLCLRLPLPGRSGRSLVRRGRPGPNRASA